MKDINKKNVTKNIERLAFVASKVESKYPKVAETIDNISESYLGLMKEAQYVGVQGYAIRNKRCFDNCLRQKRAKSDKPYEEIWNDCHGEYLEAMKNGTEGTDTWNKYASNKNENMTNFPAEFIKIADSLLEISEEVEEKESKELIAVANDLLKEAGLWDSVKGVFNKMSPSLMNIRKVLEELKRNISSAANQITGSNSNNNVGSQVKKNLYNMIGKYVQDFSSSPDFRGLNPRAKASVDRVTQSLGMIQGKIGSAKQLPELESALATSEQVISQLMNYTKGIEEDAENADIDKDGVPDNKDIDNNNNGVRDDQEVVGTDGSPASKAVSQLKQQLSQLSSNPNSKQELINSFINEFGMKPQSAEFIANSFMPQSTRVANQDYKTTKTSKRKRIL